MDSKHYLLGLFIIITITLLFYNAASFQNNSPPHSSKSHNCHNKPRLLIRPVHGVNSNLLGVNDVAYIGSIRSDAYIGNSDPIILNIDIPKCDKLLDGGLINGGYESPTLYSQTNSWNP